MVLQHLDFLTCCNIELPTSIRMLQAQFRSQVFNGEITIAILSKIMWITQSHNYHDRFRAH